MMPPGKEQHPENSKAESRDENSSQPPAIRPGSRKPGAHEILKLQQTIGNRAVQRLIKKGESRVIQRNIGFEFQTKTNLWQESTPPAVPEVREAETPLASGYGSPRPYYEAEDLGQVTEEQDKERTKLPYGKKVFDYPGKFHAESDDGELEFVTKDFNEENEGERENLFEAVSEAASFMDPVLDNPKPVKDLRTVQSWYGKGKVAPEFQFKPAMVGDFDSPLMPNLAKMKFTKAQATGGITLEGLISLFEAMTGKAAHKNAGAWKEQLGDEASATDALNNVENVQKVAEVENAPSLSEKLKGFATLVLQYLTQASDPYVREVPVPDQEEPVAKVVPIPYPKAHHTLMARTSFKAMFKMLEESDKTIFKKFFVINDGLINALPFFITPYKTSDILYEYKPGFMYPYGYYPDTVSPGKYWTEETRKDVLYGPPVKDWLASIVDESAPKPDLLTNLPGTPQNRGMGAYNRGEKSNSQKAIFELRGVGGPGLSEPSEWIKLARTVVEVLIWVNASKEEKAKSAPVTESKDSKDSEQDAQKFLQTNVDNLK